MLQRRDHLAIERQLLQRLEEQLDGVRCLPRPHQVVGRLQEPVPGRATCTPTRGVQAVRGSADEQLSQSGDQEERLVHQLHLGIPQQRTGRAEQPEQHLPVLGPEYMVGLVLRRRRPDPPPQLRDTLRGGCLIQRHTGMREHIGNPADQLLALIPGLITGNPDETHPPTLPLSRVHRTRLRHRDVCSGPICWGKEMSSARIPESGRSTIGRRPATNTGHHHPGTSPSPKPQPCHSACPLPIPHRMSPTRCRHHPEDEGRSLTTTSSPARTAAYEPQRPGRSRRYSAKRRDLS